MTDFLNTLTLLFMAASIALLWLNWRDWKGQKIVLDHTQDQEAPTFKPPPAVSMEAPPAPHSPSAMSTSLSDNIIRDVLREDATTALARPSPSDANLTEPLTADRQPERWTESADLETLVAKFESVVRGQPRRSA